MNTKPIKNNNSIINELNILKNTCDNNNELKLQKIEEIKKLIEEEKKVKKMIECKLKRINKDIDRLQNDESKNLFAESKLIKQKIEDQTKLDVSINKISNLQKNLLELNEKSNKIYKLNLSIDSILELVGKLDLNLLN